LNAALAMAILNFISRVHLASFPTLAINIQSSPIPTDIRALYTTVDVTKNIKEEKKKKLSSLC
jgi:hypothetical protein